MTETVTQAVAKRDNGPATLIASGTAGDFATVLPSHVRSRRRGYGSPRARCGKASASTKFERRHGHANHGRFELEVAAANNPGVFMAALLDAARLGLDPGQRSSYYLTPRKVGGKDGRLEILGIVGYQGYIELMYRAGAISSVIAEVVHAKDTFRYQPGRDDVPFHEIDWDSDDRGPLRLAYAYARMKDGSVSKVVVLNKTAIERIKKSSQGADSDYSPWRNHEAAMWTKSAVR
jgi:recombination protein RecT